MTNVTRPIGAFPTRGRVPWRVWVGRFMAYGYPQARPWSSRDPWGWSLGALHVGISYMSRDDK